MSQLRIYLGDVVHNQERFSPPTVPYNVARIAAYGDRKFGAQISQELFKDPHELIERLRKDPPHVLALSHYFWNSELSVEIFRFAKRVSPQIVTVHGGPNLDRNAKAYRDYAAAHPEVDFAVIGEGEASVAALVEALLSDYPDVEKTKRSAVAGCIAIIARGEIVEGRILPRLTLNDLPSPYLSGSLDRFLAMGLDPIYETVRGCPYLCAFCEQGSEFFQKISALDLDRVKEEIEYIRQHT